MHPLDRLAGFRRAAFLSVDGLANQQVAAPPTATGLLRTHPADDGDWWIDKLHGKGPDYQIRSPGLSDAGH
jgi:hypothetical protein